MAGRRLDPEEREAWQRLARSVKPIRAPRPARASAKPPELSVAPDAAPVERFDPDTILNRRPKKVAGKAPLSAPAPVRPPRTRQMDDTLDGSWERQIRGGTLAPDMAIDLHGHGLATAHLRFERALAEALALGARVLLVVTGKPRERVGSPDAPSRGAIRAEIGHWIAHSPHGGYIASARVAHPRHGGPGALYIILRRKGGSLR